MRFLRRRRFWVILSGVTAALAAGSVGGRFYVESISPEYEPRSFLVEGEKIEPAEDEIGTKLRAGVDATRLRADVEYLASKELGGRDNLSPGSELARAYLVKRLEELGLSKCFGSSFLQEVVEDDEPNGTNVAGRILGENPDADAVLLVAHYDHLGTEDGELHRGADDNASGVAIALEVARLLASEGLHGKHQVIFLFPDAEEPPDVRTDRMGSSFFVENPPVPVERLRLAIVLDVMGGQPIRRSPDLFFVMGAESSPDLVRLVRSVPQPKERARYEMMSVAMIEAEPYLPWVRKSKSDYHAFRLAERPFLFITAGTTPRYHQPDDTPDSLSYEKMAAETGFLADLVHRASLDETKIAHFPRAVDQVQDVRLALRIVEDILADPGDVLEDTQEALREDRERLLEFKTTLEAGHTLSKAEYRELMLIGLRMQCALARPTYTMCTKF